MRRLSCQPNSALPIAAAFLLVLSAGCDDAAVDEANRQVAQLTAQGRALLDQGKADEAAAKVKESLAVGDATEFDETLSLRKAVGVFRRQAAVAGSAESALKFWALFDVTELTDFQETGRRPESLWPETWGPALQRTDLTDRWRATLDRSLPEALARAEKAAWPGAPGFSTPLPPKDTTPVATAEQIDESPEAWYGKEVRVEGLRIGRIVRDAEHGCLLEVLSPDGKTYSPRPDGKTLVFAAYRDVAYRLERLPKDETTRATLFCTIKKDTLATMSGSRTFPRALVHKVELTGG